MLRGSQLLPPPSPMASEASPEFWRDRAVFVTGGTGLCGSWLINRLLQLDANVVALVRDWPAGSELVRSKNALATTLVNGDVRDQSLIERICGDYEIEAVFHLAAQTIVPVANRNPIETYDTNVRGTWSVLEACRRSPKIRAVVVASSDKAYGPQTELPYRESTPLEPVEPYDVSKACADLISRQYANTFGLPVAVTRSGNFFGGGDLNWSRVVPGTIRSIMRGATPVIRSDGTPVRDYLYVEDVVEAYLLLAEGVTAGKLVGGGVNISYEQPLSVLEMVARITRALGSSVEPVIENNATHEIQDQFLDAALLRDTLSWKPRFSLDAGLERTVAWYRAHLLTSEG
jgi:CDP-glucose 4,6-dehydratase